MEFDYEIKGGNIELSLDKDGYGSLKLVLEAKTLIRKLADSTENEIDDHLAELVIKALS